jgi:hypothetical protein
MVPQHDHKLIAKRSLSMVLRLIGDLPHRCADRGDANAERAVSFLPFKRAQFWKCVMNPFGGIALEKLQSFGHRECSRQRNQDVNVIGDSADGQRFHFVLSCDTTEVWPKSVANISTQKWLALFRVPDAMNKDTGKRMHISSVPVGTRSIHITVDPALKRWAIIKRLDSDLQQLRLRL